MEDAHGESLMPTIIEDPAYEGLYFIGPPSGAFDEDLVDGLYVIPEAGPVSGISFSWSGIDFTTDGPYYLTDVEGWSNPPDASAQDRAISGGHGSAKMPMIRGSRTVTLSGVCVGKDVRDQLLRRLDDAMAFGFDEGETSSPLAGYVAGQVLTADAQLQRYAPLTQKQMWGRGVFPWSIQWRCPDPLRYGAYRSETSVIGQSGAGLTLPLALPAAFPANPIGGQITINNPGNARTPVVLSLQGPLDQPGVIVNGGTARQRSTEYPLTLSDSDRLVIDTSSGGALLNGAYRAPRLGSSLTKKLELMPGVNSVAALGIAGASSPTLTVLYRPAYW